jgi:hypothetical protein
VDSDIESYIYRIINGYYYISINNKKYKILLPRLSIKNQAHSIYLSILDDNKFDTASWITSKAIDNLLNIYDIWNNDKQKILDEYSKNLDNFKIELYLNFDNQTVRNETKKYITNTLTEINKLYNSKHYFDYLTLEYYAQNIKNQYLVMNMIYNIDDTKVFNYNNFDDINFMFLEKFLFEIHQNVIPSQDIKKIARHEIWRSFWNISKEKIFDGTAKDWTDEQQSLVNFTKVLDSIKEHMEAPSSDVIDDDDALDGWILYQNDKNEKEKKKKQISDRYDLNNKKGNEIFILTKDKKEMNTIFGLNDNQTRKDLIAANKLINEKGTVKEADLPHVKRELRNKMNNRK